MSQPQASTDVPNRIDWCEVCGEHCTAWCPGCAACACANGCDPGCTGRARMTTPTS